MNWIFLSLTVLIAFLLRTESQPLLLNADYFDGDLLAEESHSFVTATSSADFGPVTSASSSSLSGFRFDPSAVCHRGLHPHFHPHHPPTPFAPYFPQPGYPSLPPPQPPIAKNKHGHGNPHVPFHLMQPQLPMAFNNRRQMNRKRPEQTVRETTPKTTTTPVSSISTTRPVTSFPTMPSISPVSSSMLPSQMESTSKTTEQPFYDIDIRFNDE